MSDKTEHIRHIDKTRQDHMPVAERQRVKDWRKRIHNMCAFGDTNGHNPEQDAEIPELEV